jgi:hypothetical protein
MKVYSEESKSLLSALLLTGYLSGLADSAFCSPQLQQGSGYHTDPSKPSVVVTDVDLTLEGNDRRAELLKASLKEMKSGNLPAASDLLEQLIRLAPEEPRFAQLLALVRRQLNAESWYRYQRQFRLGWARDPL